MCSRLQVIEEANKLQIKFIWFRIRGNEAVLHEYLRGLGYKLGMTGIPCEGPAYIHGDQQSVLARCGIPDSVLKKKSKSIAYHFVREGAARDEWRTYVNTHVNEADLLTKLLPSGEKRKGFVAKLLHHIFRA